MTSMEESQNNESSKEPMGQEKTAPAQTGQESAARPTKTYTKKRTVITILTLTLIWGGVGATAGYFGFRFFGPKQLVATQTGGVGQIPTKEQMDEALAQPTFLQDYAEKCATVINYALDRQTSYRYTFTITRGSTVTLGMSQQINSYNLRYPEQCFFETVSTGFVSTAGRFYDNGTDISSYKGKTAQDYPTCPEVKMTYDDYIQAYGKLFRGKYYCTTSSEPLSKTHLISDVFLTNDKDTYLGSEEKTKHEVNDIVIYYLRQNYVTQQSLKATEQGYQVDVTLTVAADTYYVAQMATTGGVGIPEFTKSTLTFQLDKDLELISGHFNDIYKEMSMECNQNLDLYFYHNDEAPVFDGTEVRIPEWNNVTDPSAAFVPLNV